MKIPHPKQTSTPRRSVRTKIPRPHCITRNGRRFAVGQTVHIKTTVMVGFEDQDISIGPFAVQNIAPDQLNRGIFTITISCGSRGYPTACWGKNYPDFVISHTS
jgi:hypothetical protein